METSISRTFVVDRQKWFRGSGGAGSALFLPDGTKCCVGFMAEQCFGISAATGKFEPYLRDVNSSYASLDYLIKSASIYAMNDDDVNSDAEREEYLTKAFAKIGYTVTFVN
jgi:hypothetical protein